MAIIEHRDNLAKGTLHDCWDQVFPLEYSQFFCILLSNLLGDKIKYKSVIASRPCNVMNMSLVIIAR